MESKATVIRLPLKKKITLIFATLQRYQNLAGIIQQRKRHQQSRFRCVIAIACMSIINTGGPGSFLAPKEFGSVIGGGVARQSATTDIRCGQTLADPIFHIQGAEQISYRTGRRVGKLSGRCWFRSSRGKPLNSNRPPTAPAAQKFNPYSASESKPRTSVQSAKPAMKTWWSFWIFGHLMDCPIRPWYLWAH